MKCFFGHRWFLNSYALINPARYLLFFKCVRCGTVERIKGQ